MLTQESLYLSDLELRSRYIGEFKASAEICFSSEAETPDKVDALVDLKQSIERRVYFLQRDMLALQDLAKEVKTYLRRLAEDQEQLITSLESTIEEAEIDD